MSKPPRLVDVGLGSLLGLAVVVALSITPAGKAMRGAARGAPSEPAPVVAQVPARTRPAVPSTPEVQGVVSQAPLAETPAEAVQQPVAEQAPSAAAPGAAQPVRPAVGAPEATPGQAQLASPAQPASEIVVAGVQTAPAQALEPPVSTF